MSNEIVTLNVSQQVAPTPNNKQRKGAFLSQGDTTLTPGTTQLITKLADLVAILTPPAAVTSITQTTGTATVTTTAPHGLTNGETISVVIAGATPIAYNGVKSATITGASTFTYTIASGTSSPATGSITWTAASVSELLAMGTTFFAQGSKQAAWVLELGEGDAADGVETLSTYITTNPGSFYAYLAPREWSAEATFFTLLGGFESDTAQTYFFCTATNGNYTSYTALMKCAFVLIEAPSGVPVTEFSCAAPFWQWLAQAPSAANKVPPFAFRFLFGVTPFPAAGNDALLATYKAANVNVVGTGAEGQISNAVLFWGTMKDGRDASYWYSVDWIQINEKIAISNEVMNGSNNTAAPLYYDQPGINRLQARALSVLNQGISFGLVTGQSVITALDQETFTANLENGVYDGMAVLNAVPYASYVAANPDDEPAGIYNGLTVVYTPSRGFTSIEFNIVVTDFVSA